MTNTFQKTYEIEAPRLSSLVRIISLLADPYGTRIEIDSKIVRRGLSKKNLHTVSLRSTPFHGQSVDGAIRKICSEHDAQIINEC